MAGAFSIVDTGLIYSEAREVARFVPGLEWDDETFLLLQRLETERLNGLAKQMAERAERERK